MGFVRLDEMTDEHPKVIAAIEAAGEAAAWLWLRSICYSARALTDGFIPRSKAEELARMKGVNNKVKALVNAGLWEMVDGGYLVHDYLEHQQSSASRKEARQRNAERVARYRARNGDVTALQAHNSDVPVMPPNAARNAPIEVEVEGTTTTPPTAAGSTTTPAPSAGLFKEIVADLERRAH